MGVFNPLRAGKPKNLGSIPRTDKIFLPSTKVQTVSGAQRASYSLGTGASFPGKKTGTEDHYSPPSSTEVKNEWSYTYTPPIGLHKMHMHFIFVTFYLLS